MFNKRMKYMALAAILMLSIGICSSSDFAEIRSPTGYVEAGSTYHWGPKVTNSEFYGFYYDIDDDFGTESIILTISDGNILEGNNRPAGVQYTTEKQIKQFKQEDWKQYESIGFLGELYFSGYIEGQSSDEESYLASKSEKKNLLSSDCITRVLIDDDTKKTVPSGSSIDLKEGYELKVSSIDVEGKRVVLELIKDGATIDSKVVSPDIENSQVGDRTYYYIIDHGSLGGLATIAVHFKNAFHGPDRDLATMDGIFQLSEYPESVKSGIKFDRMTISEVDSTYGIITLENLEDTITINRGMDEPLMKGIRIRTEDEKVAGDTSPFRFFVYKKVSDPGSYLINGRVEDVVDGRSVLWDYQNFPGFYYDIDSDLGREELEMKISGDLEEGVLNPGDVVYRATAQSIPFDYADWKNYYAIGYLGEKYFAGYVSFPDEDRSGMLWDSSENSNLISDGFLTKVLIDKKFDQNMTLSAGSTYPLQEGYEIRIKSIDVQGKKILLALARDGNEVDQSVIEYMINPVYRYKSVLGEAGEFVTIAVSMQEALTSQEMDLATINAVWQISENAIKIESGTQLGKNMDISSVKSNDDEMSIEAKNVDKTIRLKKDRIINLMEDYYIKTSDQVEVSERQPLKFFVFKGVKVGGYGGFEAPSENPEQRETPVPAQREKEEIPAEKSPALSPLLGAVCLGISSWIAKSYHKKFFKRKVLP